MNNETIGNLIRTVVREHHWAPDIISALFIDSKDCRGLVYWADDVKDSLKKKPTEGIA